ncbi:Uncharacterised protein [Serratia entomophila]|nr:Uncharacterised protein [Serratia entomophila]CAI2007425.1 Uncharacterised protein [Serratia entomophila]CAI2525226.1 Uncharacterised protein [Serratia entomophila]
MWRPELAFKVKPCDDTNHPANPENSLTESPQYSQGNNRNYMQCASCDKAKIKPEPFNVSDKRIVRFYSTLFFTFPVNFMP